MHLQADHDHDLHPRTQPWRAGGEEPGGSPRLERGRLAGLGCSLYSGSVIGCEQRRPAAGPILVRCHGEVVLKPKIVPIVASFIAAFVSTLVGVLFFFDPVTAGDATIVAIHPAVGLLVYVTLCVALFVWATNQVSNAYKGAFLIAAPQFVLILDLTLRGSRGVTTALAGTVLLFLTWLVVAFTYSFLAKRFENTGDA